MFAIARETVNQSVLLKSTIRRRDPPAGAGSSTITVRTGRRASLRSWGSRRGGGLHQPPPMIPIQNRQFWQHFTPKLILVWREGPLAKPWRGHPLARPAAASRALA